MQVDVNNSSVFYAAGSTSSAGNAFAAGGADQPPSIIFIHGAAMDHTVWVMPARYFARHGFRVVAPDLPGHGQSDGKPLATIAELKDWVFALQDALGLPQSALVGHSMGSLVGFACAASSPERVSQLALLGTSAPMPVSDGLLNAAADNDHAAIDMTNTWSHSAAGKLGSSGQPGQWNLHTGQRLLERAGPSVLHNDLAACNAFATEEFGSVADVPTLVIAGTADQMTPARAGLKVASAIHDCEQVLLPGCGHSMLSEQPNAVLDALAGFLIPAKHSKALDVSKSTKSNSSRHRETDGW